MTVSTVIALSLHLVWDWPHFNFTLFSLLKLLGILLFHCQSLVLSKDVDWLKCFLWNNFISVNTWYIKIWVSFELSFSVAGCWGVLFAFSPAETLKVLPVQGLPLPLGPVLSCWKPWDRLQEFTALGQTQHPQLERCVPTPHVGVVEGTRILNCCQARGSFFWGRTTSRSYPERQGEPQVKRLLTPFYIGLYFTFQNLVWKAFKYFFLSSWKDNQHVIRTALAVMGHKSLSRLTETTVDSGI